MAQLCACLDAAPIVSVAEVPYMKLSRPILVLSWHATLCGWFCADGGSRSGYRTPRQRFQVYSMDRLRRSRGYGAR